MKDNSPFSNIFGIKPKPKNEMPVHSAKRPENPFVPRKAEAPAPQKAGFSERGHEVPAPGKAAPPSPQALDALFDRLTDAIAAMYKGPIENANRQAETSAYMTAIRALALPLTRFAGLAHYCGAPETCAPYMGELAGAAQAVRAALAELDAAPQPGNAGEDLRKAVRERIRYFTLHFTLANKLCPEDIVIRNILRKLAVTDGEKNLTTLDRRALENFIQPGIAPAPRADGQNILESARQYSYAKALCEALAEAARLCDTPSLEANTCLVIGQKVLAAFAAPKPEAPTRYRLMFFEETQEDTYEHLYFDGADANELKLPALFRDERTGGAEGSVYTRAIYPGKA